MKKIPVVTGGIGSGKSTLTKIFEEKGFKVISADSVSAEITKDRQQEISAYFGIRPMKYESFKKELSKIVFAPGGDKGKKWLESLVLPKIRMRMREMITEYQDQDIDYITEMPTFFETKGLQVHQDYYIILVVAEVQDRVKRVMDRNGHSFEQVSNIMKTQMSDLAKCQYSDVIIYSDNYKKFQTDGKELVNKILGSRYEY